MLRVFETFLRRAGDPARRPRRRCVPSLSERVSCLEDRVLLSAAGGMAQAAEVAGNPADTRAGKEVTKLFESILQTSPTAAQLSQFVHKLDHGMSVAGLRRDLTAVARARQGTGAPVNVTMIHGGQPAPAVATMHPAAGEVMMSIQMMTSLSDPTGPNVVQRGISQIPPGMGFTVAFDPRPAPTSGGGGSAAASTPASPSPTSGGGGSAAVSTPASPSPTSPTMSPMPTMGGMSSSSGMSTPAMGSTWMA